MKITVTTNPITPNITATRKERLMWVKLPQQSFPISIHFWECDNGKKRSLISIEVRGQYISRWASVRSLWKEVASDVAYEMNVIAKQLLSDTHSQQVVADIKKQVKADKIKIEKSTITDDAD